VRGVPHWIRPREGSDREVESEYRCHLAGRHDGELRETNRFDARIGWPRDTSGLGDLSLAQFHSQTLVPELIGEDDECSLAAPGPRGPAAVQ